MKILYRILKLYRNWKQEKIQKANEDFRKSVFIQSAMIDAERRHKANSLRRTD